MLNAPAGRFCAFCWLVAAAQISDYLEAAEQTSNML
jgi:hypothetical protein